MSGIGPRHPRHLPLTFTADAGSYFRLCAVNLVLTVLTLGLYRPWAVAGRWRYLCAHTSLDGSSFEYVGSPVPLLVSQLVELGAFGLLVLLWRHPLAADLAACGLFLVGRPWLVARRLRVLVSGTVFRGVPGECTLTYGAALRVFAGGVLATVLTLGFAAPASWARWLSFLARGVSYGRISASLDGAREHLARALLRVVLLALGLALATLAIAGPAHVDWRVLSLVLAVALALLGPLVRVPLLNGITSNTALGPLSFVSRLRPGDVFWLDLGNALATVASFGLLAPWAELRAFRYRASRTSVFISGTWDDFGGVGTPPPDTEDETPVSRLAG